MNTYSDKNLFADIHDWCFVSGKISVLESQMINYTHFEKLTYIKTIKDLYKHIENTKLKNYFSTKDSFSDFEKSMDLYFLDHVKEIRLLSPSQIVCNIFLLRYEFLDLKNFLKSKLISIPYEFSAFYLFKNCEIEELFEKETNVMESISKEQINRNKNLFTYNSNLEPSHSVLLFMDIFPHWFNTLLHNINNFKNILKDGKESANSSAWIIDLIMDNAYLCLLKKIGEQIALKNIREYLDKYIFINVIESLTRALNSKSNIKLLKKYFFKGALNITYFLNLLDVPINHWKESLKKELPTEIVNTLFSNKDEKDENIPNLIKFEQLLDNYLLDIVKPAKYIAFGPERIFGYLCGLHREVYNLKLVIGGRVNKIDGILLKDRLRNCYV